MDTVVVWFLRRKVPPLVKAEGVEGAIIPVEDDLSVALKQQGESSTNGADVYRLPKAIQHQHMLVQI